MKTIKINVPQKHNVGDKIFVEPLNVYGIVIKKYLTESELMIVSQEKESKV